MIVRTCSKQILVQHEQANQETSVYFISSAFRHNGLLDDATADLLVSYLNDHLKNTQQKKKIIPFRATVSTQEFKYS